MKKISLLYLLIMLFGVAVALTIYWRCTNTEVKEMKGFTYADVLGTFGDESATSSQATTQSANTNPASTDTPVTTGNAAPPDQSPPGTSVGANGTNPTTAPSQSPASDGPCGPGGICSMDSLNNTMHSPHSTRINFQYDSSHGTLIMSFLKDDLDKKQHGHLQYFQDPSRLYKFHSTYYLSSNPLLSKLGLPANSRIRPEDSCIIQDEKDGKIIVNIKFSHD